MLPHAFFLSHFFRAFNVKWLGEYAGEVKEIDYLTSVGRSARVETRLNMVRGIGEWRREKERKRKREKERKREREKERKREREREKERKRERERERERENACVSVGERGKRIWKQNKNKGRSKWDQELGIENFRRSHPDITLSQDYHHELQYTENWPCGQWVSSIHLYSHPSSSLPLCSCPLLICFIDLPKYTIFLLYILAHNFFVLSLISLSLSLLIQLSLYLYMQNIIIPAGISLFQTRRRRQGISQRSCILQWLPLLQRPATSQAGEMGKWKMRREGKRKKKGKKEKERTTWHNNRAESSF